MVQWYFPIQMILSWHFTLAVSSTFFSYQEKNIKIIYNIHQPELNNEIKINLLKKNVFWNISYLRFPYS